MSHRNARLPVDDHSRLAYSEILSDEQGRTCAAFLLRAAAAFAAAVGITRIERVMTDNHWSYTKSEDVREAMKFLGAKHKLIRAHWLDSIGRRNTGLLCQQ